MHERGVPSTGSGQQRAADEIAKRELPGVDETHAFGRPWEGLVPLKAAAVPSYWRD